MKHLSNNQGLTFIEVLVGAGLAGLISLALASFTRFTSKSQAVLSEQVDSISDGALQVRVIQEDLSRSGASFEVLSAGTGAQARFFDYSPGGSCSDCDRRIVLTALPTPGTLEASSIDFVVDELKVSRGVGSLNPLTFYDAVTQGDPTGELIINRESLRERLSTLALTLTTVDLAANGRVLLFYSPQRMRVPGVGGDRMPVFVVRVEASQGQWELEPPALLGTQRHPATGVAFVNEDMFFRNMPSTGGQGHFVLVKPVKLIRYLMVPGRSKSGATVRLIRAQYDAQNDQFPDCTQDVLPAGCMVLGTQMRRIEFARSDTASTVIRYRMDMERLEFNN